MSAENVMILPEKVVLRYQLASIGSRIGAQMLDLILCVLLIVGETLLAGMLMAYGLAPVAVFLRILYIPTIFLYFCICEYFWNGRTVGKLACNLRVRMVDGTPITAMGSLGRNILRMADFLPFCYFVGLLCMVMTKRCQRFGDLAAGTAVFYEPRPDPTFRALTTGITEHPLFDVIGDLKGMTKEEFLALQRLYERFPQLTAPSQTKLINEVWLPIANRLSVPPQPHIHPMALVEAVILKYGQTRRL